MCSRKPDLHTFGGKGDRIIKTLAVELQHNSENKHSQSSAKDFKDARLGRNPNLGESLLF